MDKHTISQLFENAASAGASDVHMAVGAPLLFRINGHLEPQSKQDVTVEQAEQIIKAILGDARYKRNRKRRRVWCSRFFPLSTKTENTVKR